MMGYNLKPIEKSLAHIESLLQRMPEMIAAAVMIELERKEQLQLKNQKYTDGVALCPINRR